MRIWVGVLCVSAALLVGKVSQALDFDEVGSAIGLLGSITPLAECLDADAVEAALDPSHFADRNDAVISENVASMYAAQLLETTGSLPPGTDRVETTALRGSLPEQGDLDLQP